MMETVKIRRAGYPVRRPFPDFIYRYVFGVSSLFGISSK